jgi:polar amino acid transport system substrate-binding protein
VGRRDTARSASLTACAVALFAACANTPVRPPAQSPTAGDPADDKLAQVLAHGKLVLPTDPAYPPASFSVDGATRPGTTKCAADELTGVEVDGYDVATSKLVAEALGLEPCFVTPPWNAQLAGHWGDRFDIAFSSIGITRSRMGQLYFTKPYYATPESFFVRDDAAAKEPEDLAGLRIGVCTGCFADLYLQRKLDLPGAAVDYRVDDPVIVGYGIESAGLADVAAGRLDAFLCQDTAGGQAIADGQSLRAISPPAYVAFPAGALDRSSTLTLKPFFDRVNEILAQGQQDGTLSTLSKKYFDHDYASAAADFDMAALGQVIE